MQMKRLVVLLSLCVLLLAGLVQARQDEPGDDEDIYYVSILTAVNIRSSATTNAEVIGSLLPGTAVRVVDVVSGTRINNNSRWYVVNFQGRVGYVHSSLLVNPNVPTPTLVPTVTPPPPPTAVPPADTSVDMFDCDVEGLMTDLRAMMLDSADVSEEEQFNAMAGMAREVLAMEAACEALFAAEPTPAPEPTEAAVEETTAEPEAPIETEESAG
jgi:hypothetical protein